MKKCRTVSEKQLAANRRNALKSTGPRTAEGKRQVSRNSFRHGLYAMPGEQMHDRMARLDEDPDQLAHFERELTKAWAPENAMQALIVSDLARLFWKKSQLAKTLVDAREDEKKVEAAAVARFTLECFVESPEINQTELAELGYRQLEKSRPVYLECQRLLTDLAVRVEARDWSGDLSAILVPLYGVNPAPRGRRIINLVLQCASATGEAPADLDEPDGSDEPDESDEPNGQDDQDGTTGLDEQEVTDEQDATPLAELDNLLKQEVASLALEQKLYQDEKKAMFTDSSGSAWLPSTENWGRALDQDAKLTQQIERQSKLLMSLKRQRRSARHHAEAA